MDVDARLRTMLLRFFLAELWRQVCVSELQKERANLAFWVSESVKNVLIARIIWQCLLLPNAAAGNIPQKKPGKSKRQMQRLCVEDQLGDPNPSGRAGLDDAGASKEMETKSTNRFVGRNVGG